MIKFKLKPPINKVERKFRNRIASMKDLSKPMKKISIMIDRWTQDNFRTEGGNVGGWEPLAHGGRFVKKNGGWILDESAKILQDTGALRISTLPFHTKRTAGIGSELPYSKKHNEGEDGLPVRRIIPEKSKDKGIIAKSKQILTEYGKRVLK